MISMSYFLSTQLTEQHMRSLKGYELKAKTTCINIQHEKGSQVRLVEFFDDQIKKYEFQLGITTGILDESLVKENQIFQEKVNGNYAYK